MQLKKRIKKKVCTKGWARSKVSAKSWLAFSISLSKMMCFPTFTKTKIQTLFPKDMLTISQARSAVGLTGWGRTSRFVTKPSMITTMISLRIKFRNTIWPLWSLTSRTHSRNIRLESLSKRYSWTLFRVMRNNSVSKRVIVVLILLIKWRRMPSSLS